MKETMNTREAYAALAAGHKVKDCDGDVWSMDEEGALWCVDDPMLSCQAFAPFTLHEEPATDEELVAEMERLATVHHPQLCAREALLHCARMLHERKVTP